MIIIKVDHGAPCQAVLPWTVCHLELAEAGRFEFLSVFFLTTYVYPRLCVAGGGNSSKGDTNLTIISSAEQYFKRGVLKEDTDLSKGLGAPDLQLALCLAGCWVLLFLTMWKGMASSGKVSSLDPPIEIE